MRSTNVSWDDACCWCCAPAQLPELMTGWLVNAKGRLLCMSCQKQPGHQFQTVKITRAQVEVELLNDPPMAGVLAWDRAKS